ncbi:NTP transferase domain-containing protein [Cellulomonas hominis]
MQVPATVVVNAAGLGSRLGLDRPKALLELEGRPLIAWQLAMLRDVPDVRVVLGYQAAEVADVVFAARPGATVVLNHQYSSTGTAASLMRGALGVSGRVVSLDCDLVVHPADLASFVHADEPVLGVLPVQSNEPVLVRVDGDAPNLVARGFDRERRDGDYEWSGLISFDPRDRALGPTSGHVFQLVAGLLPMRAQVIRAREVDFPDEVAPMTDWIRQLRDEEGLA